MKKIILSALTLITCACFFTACEDDRDSNPTLLSPSTFVLNTPAYAASEVDLGTSSTLNFTCSQPDFGYTAAVTYGVELSLNNSFTVSVAQAEAVEDGSLTADYAAVEESYTNCKISTDATLFSKALQQLAQWDEAEVPAVQSLFVRLSAKVDTKTTYSNSVEIKVVPYYVELKDAPVELWYLIGSCIGDGAWNNSVAGIGTSIYPMALVKDYEYDKKTGQGELTFTGYLTPDGFKLVKNPGSWDDQWGQGDAFGTFVKNDGGSGNITVPEAGYYTITLNTAKDEMTINAAELAATVYPHIMIAGDFNGWATDVQMTAVNTTVANNHIWSYTLDATGGDTTAKFLYDDWQPNWGAETFPYGYGVGNGPNIPVTAGKYVVVFNDIDGSYAFITVE